jgi:poly-gamma-glutamate synthesis protein (capsule biosynthesis protein)
VRSSFIALLSAALGCSAAGPASKLEPALGALSVEAPAPPPARSSEPDIITVSAVGDCALGDLQHGAGAPGSMSALLRSMDDPMGYPFSQVRELFAADDLTLANLEGVLSERDVFQNDVFSIRGPTRWAEMLGRGGVDAVNLANNHSHDYGEVGHEDTKRALETARIAYFGRGTVDRRRIKGIDVVNLGYLGGPAGTLERMVRDVTRERRERTIVIVSFHWGVEGYYAIHPEQTALGHAAIDAGADLVVGHHPHVLQGIETYRERHIIYSLGNFVFGANSKPTDRDSLIYQERFHMSSGKLTRVEQRLWPVAISGDRVVNDFRPVLLTGSERERVLAKVAELSATL